MKRSALVSTLFGVLAYAYAHQSSARMARLIGGHELEPDDTPYLVSLQSDGEHFCGGSIIHDRYILTAAHCFLNDSNELDDANKTLKVVAGTNDLTKEKDDEDVVEVGIEKIYVPSSYNHTEWRESIPSGDMAVLKLKQSLDLRRNSQLSKLRLPRRRRKKYRTYENEDVVIAGFGWDKVKLKQHKNETEYEVGSSNDRLFGAKAEVVGNDECQQRYVNVIRESELCARVVEHDDDTPQGVCRGDSGGPLVYNSNTIIGIVSGIAMGCNENEEPGIYCRVSSYVGFVKDAMRDKTEDMRVFTI